jgi:hypothetical protein
MKRIKFIFAITLLLLLSCETETVTTDIIHIHIDPDNVIKEYDIADDVEAEWEIFRLETSDECLVADISKIIFQNGMYYILDNVSVINVFDSNGKFLKKLDRKGQGPGEYTVLKSFDVIGHDVWVSDVNRRRLMVFDSMFNFKYEVPDLNLMASHINHIGDNIYLASNWFNNDERNCQLLKYNIRDSAFKCLIEVGQLETNFSISKIQQMCRYGDDCLLFMQSYCDTIFQIIDSVAVPKYKFSFSSRYQDILLTYEQALDRGSDEMIRGIEEINMTKNSVILDYGDMGMRAVAIYNKTTKQSRVYSYFKHSTLGNIELLALQYTPENELIFYHQPSAFLEEYDKLLDESKFKNPADLQKIKDAVKGIIFDDNPVIIKFKLKKDSKL